MMRSTRKAIFTDVRIRRLINIRAGLAGAVVMGFIVWIINLDHGTFPAWVAAMKQAAYTFLLGGLLIRLLEIIVTGIHKRNAAVFTSVMVVSILTISLVFIVHSLKGTPEPVLSTLPTVLLAPPGFAILAWRKRKKKDKDISD